MENTVQYTLRLRFVGSETKIGSSELEVVAHPCQEGQPYRGRFLQWEPVFESICSWVSSSAFHRKAIQRTLAAGLPAYLINRETGSKHVFSAEEVARLCLTASEAEALLGSDPESGLSTAA
jgi:hypothetical protein